MRFWLIAGGGILVGAILLTWFIEWTFAADGVELGFHGTFAVFLCLIFVPGLTIALMRLAHLSDRTGVDREAAERYDDELHRRD
ncbi:MAG: hypothetical protein GDA49_02925 [Rhodospirillales bacterium]|nr:hypothetical protein [Rhodospirillales bacterium]